MNTNLSSDKPIQQEQHDKFQRYNFSKSIAKTIKKRNNIDCIVIGLYGAWGEGKTSVLNFIDYELSGDPDIIIVKFNPWRFKDEEALLKEFFNLLAIKLDAKLESSGNKVGELLKKYGKLSSPVIKLLPYIGDLASALIEQAGGTIQDETIEEIKKKIDTILVQNQKKIVVFIDDIDRLNKSEIYSIFRLVKLTADFYNTTYILSFDERMVAEAIGENFGEGNKEAGKSFLEKIIQVPLNLPLAQADALQQFCFDIINKTFELNKIVLDEDEGKRFSGQFQNYILPRLHTPRLAVRYGNALSFAIPLLIGEVDIDDLLIIEAIKIFYPKHYEFIKLNPDYFIGSYNNVFSSGKNVNKKEEFEKHMYELGLTLTKKQKDSIQNLLEELFPRLQDAFHNRVYTDLIEVNFFKEKRIGSPKHFNRFFSYSVIKGDLSDIAFKNFIDGISQKTVDEVVDSIKKLVEQSTPENFLIKIRSWEESFTWSISQKLAKAITLASDIFPKQEGKFFMRFEHPNGQSQIFIRQLIKKHNNDTDKTELVKELIEEAKHFDYIYSLLDWFRDTNSNEPAIFSEKQLLALDYKLIKRAIREAGETSVFEKFSENIVHLINSWAKINQPELEDYTKERFGIRSSEVILLLKIYTPTVFSSAEPASYKTDFTRDYYNHFISIFDKEFIKEWILKVFTIEQITEQNAEWFGRNKGNKTDLNIVRQFFHWIDESETSTS